MPVATEPCRFCGRLRTVAFDTNNGRLIEIPDPCGCPGERRALGVCRTCPRPVDGTIGKALYCTPCRKAATAEYGRRYRRSRKGKRAQRRDNARRRQPEERAKIRMREREYRKRPEVKARRRQRQRREAITHPERKAERHRRYKEKYPERVLEQQRRANAKRRKARLAYMHRYKTRYVGPGVTPKCTRCDAEIPFDGRGRPFKLCRDCDPKRWRAAERRRARKEQREQLEEAA